MSTPKRIDSSRANGPRSRGLATPDGRARSRAARLTHGLTSDLIVLEYESQNQFNALREEYLAEYQPRTRFRFDLVDHLAATRWRLNRVIALQTALRDNEMVRQQPEIRAVFGVCSLDTQAAIANQHLTDDGGALESLNRHEARLSAELRRTLKLLDAAPKNRKVHDEPNDAQPTYSYEDRFAPEGSRLRSAIAHREPSTIDQPPSTTFCELLTSPIVFR